MEQAVHLLMCNPEDFYEVANYVAAQLAQIIQDDDSLTVVVDKLVDQVRPFINLTVGYFICPRVVWTLSYKLIASYFPLIRTHVLN